MNLAVTDVKEKSHDWTHITMFDDLEFRRFLFRCALPIFTAVMTKQVAEIFTSVLGRGNWYSFTVLCIGFSITLGLCIRLYHSVVKSVFRNETKEEKQ